MTWRTLTRAVVTVAFVRILTIGVAGRRLAATAHPTSAAVDTPAGPRTAH